MPAKRQSKEKITRINLLFQVPGQDAEVCRVPVNVTAHELVFAARGKFLPAGVLPSRLMRDGSTAPYFHPIRPLADANPQDGDVLLCESDTGQPIEEPSLLGAYRAMTRYAENALQETASRLNKSEGHER